MLRAQILKPDCSSFQGVDDAADQTVLPSIDHHPFPGLLHTDDARDFTQQFLVERVLDFKGNPVLRPQRIDQFLGCVQGDDLAVIDDGHPVAQALRLLHEMRRQEDGRALFADAPHLLPHGPPCLWVQAGGQLIQEGQVRVVDQRQRDKDPLLLPTGKLGEMGIPLVCQAHLLQQELPVDRAPVERGKQVQRFPDLDPIGQGGRLKLDPNPFPQPVSIPQRVKAQYLDRAAVRPAQPLETLDGGGLACPVRPNHPKDLTPLNTERDSIHRLHPRVVLGQVPYVNDDVIPCVRIHRFCTPGIPR